MVAIIHCSPDEEAHVEFYKRLLGMDFPEWTWSTNRPRRLWTSGAHLTLIVTGASRGNPEISHLAWTKRARQVDDLNQKLEVSRIYTVEPKLATTQLFSAIPNKNMQHLRQDGQQTDGTGKALLEAMFSRRPGWRPIVDMIQALSNRHPIGTTAAAQILAQQRDASIGIGRMAGFNLADLGSWSPPPDPLSDSRIPPTFLSGVHGEIALEDQLVNQDMHSMLDMVSEPTSHVNWRLFRSHGRQLFIVNANREPAERILGVDLIYYNVNRQSFVLVQYKKLDATQNGRYYPSRDSSLDKELRRMRALDRYVNKNRKKDDDFRLLPSPSWIKLCHPLPYVPNSTDMIHGMYLAREHFELLRNNGALKGPNGGTVFSYRTVPNYLDNTTFTRLVETGMIGTTGTSTQLVHQQVIRSFTNRRAIALGMLAGDTLTQSERNNARRSRR